MNNIRYQHRAFSLLEMMFATLILGFGLLTVATVLPIVWRGAVRTTALTQADGVTEYARMYLQKKALIDSDDLDLFDGTLYFSPVDAPDGTNDSLLNDIPALLTAGAANPGGHSYSLRGDWDTIDAIDEAPADGLADTSPLAPGELPHPFFNNIVIRPRVHALHMENWVLSENSEFRYASANNGDNRVPEAPLAMSVKYPLLPQPYTGIPASVALQGAGLPDYIGQPVVPLKDRLFPPLNIDLLPGSSSVSAQQQWEDVLNETDFVWGAFHKLQRVPRSIDEPRHFLMYYVTLQRGGSTARFARQAFIDGSATLSSSDPPLANIPGAEPGREFMAFPVPWRVPIILVESQTPGVPAIAYVGAVDGSFFPSSISIDAPTLAVDNALVPISQFFIPGNFFVDELSGIIYQVTNREYLDVDNHVARLTLDKDIRPGDLEIVQDGTPDVLENNPDRERIVWIYPPATRPGSVPGSLVVYGGNPVVDIRVEQLTLLPQVLN